MTSKNFKQSMVNQDQEIIFEVVKVSGSWVFPAASSIVEATRGKNMYLRLTDDGRSDIFRLDSVKDGENAGETVFGFVGNGGMDLVELTSTTDGSGATTGSWDYEPGEGPAGEAIGNLGQPLQWKGPATVAELNAGITGIQPGWTYTLTDAGTLTDGSVKVDVGDEVAWTEDGEWFQVGPSLVELKADVVQAKSDIADIQDVVPEEASDSNKLVTKDELDNVQESIQSGFTPKGEISVSDLNDLTTQSNGDQYILTDSGTITDGSVTVEAGDSVAWNFTDSVWYKVNQYALSKYGTDEIKNLPTSITAFRTGDVIPVDGPSGTAKMSKDDLLREAAQNALADNVAPEFVPNSTTIVRWEPYIYNGSLYVAVEDGYQGPWDSSKFTLISSSDLFAKVAPKVIYHNLTTNPASLNDLKDNCTYIVYRTSSTTTTDFPSGSSNFGILSITKSYYSSSYYFVDQIYKQDNGTEYYRQYNSNGNTWTAWKNLTEAKVSVQKNAIHGSWSSNLSNLNDAPINSIIVITARTADTTTANFPSDFGTGNGSLETTKAYFSGSINYVVRQKLTKNGGFDVWIRNYTYLNGSGSWGAWVKQSLPTNEFHVGSGQAYTTLRDGITAAYQSKGAKVIIHPGTYDLIAECSDVINGTELTVNFTPCPLGNDMHIICMDGVKVSAMLEKGEFSDAAFNSYKVRFEPMAFQVGNYTIENLNIESKNTRYCIHDDQGGSAKPCIHKYINCKMYRTNSNITPDSNFVSCIGGGMGKHSTIVVDGGYYRSDPVVGSSYIQGGDIDYQQIPISYHNGNNSECEGSIVLKNVYFADKGYFGIYNYGDSTSITQADISGCRFGLPPMKKNATSDPAADNMNYRAVWNNEIAQDGEWQIAADGVTATFIPN